MNLPDDLTAGDTIFCTAVAEAKAETETERQANNAALNSYMLELLRPFKPQLIQRA